MKGNIAYLTLQATRQGQASYAHVHEIIRGLRNRGWRVELFEPSHSRIAEESGAIRRLIEFLRVQLLLWRNAKDVKAVYIRAHFGAFPTAVWAKLRGLPVVQEVNGPYQDLFAAWPSARPFAFLLKAMIRSSLKWADEVVAVTPQLGQWVANEVGRQNIRVVPNAANCSLFAPDAKSAYNLPKPYVVFFGALARWQGIDTLLAATQNERWPRSVTLVVVGDGAERRKVEDAAREYSNVRYLGKVPYADVPGIVANSLMAISPQSNLAGRAGTGLYPLKVFEALACGVPVIVTDFPGQADLVRTYECGLVVPPENPELLAEAVTRMYEDEETRREMGRRGRAAIVADHSWQHRADTIAQILENLLAQS